jgi:hypothetical protein
MATETASPPSGVTIVDTGPPKPPPAPTREIRVSQMTPTIKPEGERLNKTSREKISEGFQKYAKPIGEPVVVPTDPERPGTKTEEKPADKPEGEVKDGEKPAGEEVPHETKPEKPAEKPGKANPWKLLEVEKAQRRALEQEIQTLKAQGDVGQNYAQEKALRERFEKQAKDQENILRLKAYEETEEFKTKYNEPYQKSFRTALEKVGDVSFTDPKTGETRTITFNDLNELLFMNRTARRDVCKTLFGEDAGDVIEQVKNIQTHLTARTEAIEAEKKNGAERERQAKETLQNQITQTKAQIQAEWKAINDEFMQDPVNSEYFKPKVIEDGKEATPEEKEWNESLGKGFKLVDAAFKGMQLASNLTPEQRKEMIRHHVALRYRAAAFGPIKRLAKRLQGTIDRMQKELSGYTASTPGTNGQQATRNGLPTSHKGAKAEVFSALRALAK